LLDLLDADLAWLHSHPDATTRHRPVHAAEAAMVEALVGHRPSRRERRTWNVAVRACADGRGVVRLISRDGQVVAELRDEPADHDERCTA